MNRSKKIGLVLAAALLVGASGPAFAHGHWHRPHWGVGVYLGAPVVWQPFYYPPPVVYAPGYYTPPTVIVREAPPAYVERGASSYWYYCDMPAGYYPYVKECQGTWRAVSPDTVPPPR